MCNNIAPTDALAYHIKNVLLCTYNYLFYDRYFYNYCISCISILIVILFNLFLNLETRVLAIIVLLMLSVGQWVVVCKTCLVLEVAEGGGHVFEKLVVVGLDLGLAFFHGVLEFHGGECV